MLFDNYPDIITVKELQSMLRVGRNTAYSLVKSGTIYSKRFGAEYLIPKQCVVEFVLSKQAS